MITSRLHGLWLDIEEDGQIISRETIEKSIDEGEAYRIVDDGKPVGGVVIKVDGDRGDLEMNPKNTVMIRMRNSRMDCSGLKRG